MIPQADQKWFTSQVVWISFFFLLNYYINWQSYNKIKKKQKDLRNFLTLNHEQIREIKEDIAKSQAQLNELQRLEFKEKELVRNGIKEGAKVEINKIIEVKNSENKSAIMALEKSVHDWASSFTITDITRAVNGLIIRIEEKI